MTDANDIKPYVGIRPFEENDRQFFFGRERDIELLLNRIYASQCVVVFAPSGAGKTSLLRAGVLPNLGSDDKLKVVYFNEWKERPLTTIQKEIGSLTSGRSSREGLLASLESFSAESKRRPLLVLDQFEEVGRYTPDLSPLWDELAPLANSLGGPAKMIISIREDYLGDLDDFMTRVPGLMDCRFRVQPLSLQAFRLAISGPLTKVVPPFSADPRLVDEIVSDLDRRRQDSGREARIEPGYLQLVCKRLWEIEKGNPERQLRLHTYLQEGRARKIVEGYIRGIIQGQLGELDQQIFFGLSRYMVLPKGKKLATGAEDLTQLVRKEDFTYEGWQAFVNQVAQAAPKEYPLNTPRLRKRVERILDTLTNRDSLMLRRKMVGATPEYELCHDVLGTILVEWRYAMKAASEFAWQVKYEERAKEYAKKLKESQNYKRMGRVAALGSFVYGALFVALTYRHKAEIKETLVAFGTFVLAGILGLLRPRQLGQALSRVLEIYAKKLRELLAAFRPGP